jgi:hypothetical protein
MQPGKSDFVRRSEMVRVEFSAATRAGRALAWQVFSDWRRWQRFSDFYGDIRWLTGRPWSVGSRLRIELVRPVKTTVDHVITVCSPGECVAWIDHALGNTMEQWVILEPREDGGTSVQTWAEVAGWASTIAGVPIRCILKSFIELWYSRFCRECDALHNKSASQGRKGEVPLVSGF